MRARGGQGRASAWSALVIAAIIIVITPGRARAHDFKPALLALTARGPSDYDVVWRVPVEAGNDPLRPVFPAGSARVGAGTRTREGDTLAERFQVHRDGGLGGQALRLAGTSPFVNEVLVRAELGPGQVVTGRLRPGPGGGTFDLPATPTHAGVAATYLRLGVEHILSGLDHLAFVLALVLLAGRAAAILRAVTAFTVAHSVTLGLAALGLAHVPQPPVEATIALSIVFVARELALRRMPFAAGARGDTLPVATGAFAGGAKTRAPTAMAFGFGLLHGLGFAGALAEVGLPAADIPLALLCFNLGVEIGQLAFVLLVLALGRVLAAQLARVELRSPAARRARPWLSATPAAAIGALGAFWLFDRIAGFFR
jgi:hydrogenase/urease accessory protein HupE